METLKNQSTNIAGSESYDKIFYKKDKYFELANSEGGNGGVFRFFNYIYHEDSYSEYQGLMKAHKDDPSTLVDEDSYKRYFKNYWRKNQLSDHYPIWVEMEIDSTDEFLSEKKASLEAVSE